MNMDIIKIIAEGGCYWPALKKGVALAFPNGTPFRIPIDGEKSHRFGRGACLDGYFVLNSGERFETANGVVAEVRKDKAIATNAYLYIDFLLDGEWVRASDLRKRETAQADDDRLFDAVALHGMKQAYIDKMRINHVPVDPVKALRLAAQHLLRRRDINRKVA
jgi:hypothetical protein